MTIKEKLLKIAERDLSKYYPIEILKELGYVRKKCKICKRNFWTKKENKEICDDHVPYLFLKDDKNLKHLSYPEIWNNFKEFMNKRGYGIMPRYPVLAKWREDMDFVIASIIVFQPYVVSGEVDPPFKKLVIPQFCLRFSDVDNVGITSRHYTGFDMIGQHAFVKPEEFDINSYFKDLLEWFKSVGFSEEDITLHEDVWYGGGNAGVSLEFFYKGIEVANQVYMFFSYKDSEIFPLTKLKVLDMGMGHERVSWILNHTNTSYDSVFPNVIKYLIKNTNLDLDFQLYKEISIYLKELEEDFDKGIDKISKELKIDKDKIKEIILNFSKIYSIADHTRTLLIAISDGALPSNVGGGYNLRSIFRRAYSFFINNFSGDFFKLFEIHVKDIEGLYTIKKEDLDVVFEVIDNEIKKYKEFLEKVSRIKEKYKKKKPTVKELFTLYISYGIRPEDLGFEKKEEFEKILKEFRERSKEKKEKYKIILEKEYPATKEIFYEDWKRKIHVAKCIGFEKEKYAIFDSTIFYPEGGGQESDKGWIIDLEKMKEICSKISEEDFKEFCKINFGYYPEDIKKYLSFAKESNIDLEKIKDILIEVKYVVKEGKVVLHEVSKRIESGKEYLMILDWKRRLKLTMYHDAVHILNGVLRKKYGKIIWQSGAEKKENCARLDVTYYRIPSIKEIFEIEREVNKIIWENRKINKKIMPRIEAEMKYGIQIYQGGAVPGKNIRIVEIEGIDFEACGGTHGDNTGYIGLFLIKKVEKISDSIIRFEILINEDALDYLFKNLEKLYQISDMLGSNIENIDKSVKKVFNLMKTYKKDKEKYLDLISDIICKNNIKEIKVQNNLELSDLTTLASNLIRKKIEKFIIYNDNYLVGYNISDEEIKKKGFEIVRKGKFIVGKRFKL